MFDRRYIMQFNWALLLASLILAALGLVNLYSATSSFEVGPQASYFRAQIVWTLWGLVCVLVVISMHYRYIEAMSYTLYALTIILLVAVLFIGKEVSGHQSWLYLGPVRIQPTEIAKLGLILALAKHLSQWTPRVKAGLQSLVPSFIFFLLPTILVVIQGDLGSSLFFGLIYGSLVLIHGVRWQVIVPVICLLLTIACSAYFFVLSPYQKNRIQTFLNPEADQKGAGYHLIQSKIAVGSGWLTGKGYLKGQSHKLKFVPERHTDFVFPVLAEEWGFLGSFMVLLSFMIFLLLSLQVAYKASSRYNYYLAVGVTALFFWHVVINLGGVLGLMPLTGVPLPFFSYGGSALMTGWIGIGLLLNIHMRRFIFT